MAMSLALGLGLGMGGNVAAAAPAVAGTSPTTFTTITPSVRYHPHSQAGTVTKSGSEITACPDLMGLAALSATAGTAPVEMTDALGRKFWRFEESAAGSATRFAQVADAFVSDVRATACLFVGRYHRAVSGSIMSLGRNAGTAPSTSTGLLSISVGTSEAPVLRSLGTLSSGDATNKKYMPVGSQMQVLASVSRTTANGAQVLCVNNRRASVSQAAASGATAGAEIGRFAFSANAYGVFDLYEIILISGTVTNAAIDTAMAEAMANYGIVEATDRLVLAGDSRFQGTGNADIASGGTLGMLLTDPSAGYVPATYCVVNMGASGAQVADLVAKRDAVGNGGMFSSGMANAGAKVVVAMIGTNDVGNNGAANTAYTPTTFNTVARGDAVVAAIKTLYYNGTTGYLDRGWTAWAVIEPAYSTSLWTSGAQIRVGMRAAAFLTDCHADTGNTYDGKLFRLEIPLITVSGDTKFDTDNPDALDTAIYPTNSVHWGNVGLAIAISGGDTPANGFGSVV